ncbi:cytochrome P450 [Streptomyces sp. RB6PN25]|uniref:Cytochrome P450 n=1 Tax=Streptomyces humicola TaxID=2953240 RepID=A0ABT1Q418_9ACTN|nr:cytochrome P450 [Streptomyces humicola]MCQ4084671.1 cytochrome P450 [Streptomyces humicola]
MVEPTTNTAVKIVDLAAYGERFTADPYPVYAELREKSPVHYARLPHGNEVWLVVGHEEVRAALADPTLSKSWLNSEQWTDDDELYIGTHMLNSDPPHHTRLRKLVAKEFTPRRVEALRPRIQQITDELLDAMPATGRVDLVEALAFPLPMTVICELLGVPFLEREAFRGWSNEIIAPVGDPERQETAFKEMGAYLSRLVEEKRERPGDDLMSALIRTTDEDGDRLSHDELRAMAFLLLVAGHETTVNLIANGVLALLTHPDQLAELRADWSLLDAAVEEMLRYDGPVETSTFRFTTRPLEIGGTVIPGGGAPVLVVIAAADRDPGRFPAPDEFDIHRPAGGHLAFGHGIHYCLGAPLARLEGRIAVRSLLERFPRLALDADPATLGWRSGALIRGVRSLPVRGDGGA